MINEPHCDKERKSMFEGNGHTRRIEKELFATVYGWGKFGVVTDELCNTFQDYMQELQYDWHEQFCEMYEICSACGDSMADGHYNNNAECQRP